MNEAVLKIFYTFFLDLYWWNGKIMLVDVAYFLLGFLHASAAEEEIQKLCFCWIQGKKG